MAVGIGLVFGVLRLVNFAYGQLIMAGAYALAFASAGDWPVWAAIALCFAVVIALSLVHGARRLPAAADASRLPSMLVATFAVAFLLQSDRAPVAFGHGRSGRRPRRSLRSTGRSRSVASTSARSRSSRSSSRRLPRLLVLLLERTTRRAPDARGRDGLPTARLLGVRANRVIGSAVLVSGVLAATVAVILTVQHPLVTPDFALQDTIVVLAGVVVGGMNRL